MVVRCALRDVPHALLALCPGRPPAMACGIAAVAAIHALVAERCLELHCRADGWLACCDE